MHSGVASSKTLRLVLHALTSIHVWSGRKLFMGLDIIRKGSDTLCLVDVDRLPPEVVEELTRVQVDEIAKTLEKYLAKVPCKQEVKVVISISPTAQVLELNPYVVPGSTLKGYIRTSILFYLLKSLGDRNRVKSVLRSGVDLYKDPEKVSEGLEAQFFRAPKPPRQGGFIDSFQSLLVSDPEVDIDLKCYTISELQVYEFEAKALKRIASHYAVTINCGELRYRIDLRVPRSDIVSLIMGAVPQHKDDAEKLWLLRGVDLIKALKEFGCFILSKELEKVKMFRELSEYTKLLENLQRKYCEKIADCVIARLGYMTGHITKTILGIVKDVDPQLYQDIRSFMEGHIHHTWDEYTIKLVKTPQGLVGPGWCELCLE